MRICGGGLVLVCYTGETGIVWWLDRKRGIRADYEYVDDKKKRNDNVEK